MLFVDIHSKCKYFSGKKKVLFSENKGDLVLRGHRQGVGTKEKIWH